MRNLRVLSRLITLLSIALVMAGLLCLPDIAYHWWNPDYQARLNTKDFFAMWTGAVLLLGLNNPIIFLAFLAFVATLQLAQFLHIAYFGTLIAPHEVVFLFREWDEIWLTIAAIVPYFARPLLTVLACSGLLWLLWRYSRNRTPRIPFAPIILLLLLAIMPCSAYLSQKSQRFYPNPKASATRNTYYAFSWFIGSSLRGEHQESWPTFKPYRVMRLPDAALPSIVVIMGESLTWKHMGLFGYKRDTTPWLSSQKNLADFVFHRAIAGGVDTKTVLPTFFNIQREPGNMAHLLRYESNLFKMAKERGLGTHYLSAQTANLSTYSGSEFADRFVTQEEMSAAYERDKDFVLLEKLASTVWSRPQFIVLHQRNSHAPYEQSSLPAFDRWPVGDKADRHTYVVNTYDNSIRMTDELIRLIVDMLITRSTGPVYVFVTSDHGEMMGENSRYGHFLLEADVVHVPFLFFALRGDPEVVSRIRRLHAPTHYDIGLEIARLLGYTIENPNATPGRYYVNGPDLGGGMGCMALDKDTKAEYGWRLVDDDPLCKAKLKYSLGLRACLRLQDTTLGEPFP